EIYYNKIKRLNMKLKSKRKTKKGSKFITKIVEATGIPQGYSATIAWFAERMALATLCLTASSFAAGAMFVLHLSEPIANSKVYTIAEHRAQLAEQGIRVFSQQVIDIASPIFTALIRDNRDEEELA